MVGDITVVPLLDAVLDNPVTEAVPGIPAEVLRQRFPDLARADGVLALPVTCYLVRSAGRTILVDTGIGPRPRGDWPVGVLDRELASAGVSADAVDVVVNTHFHGDHVGWNTIDDPDGVPKPTFGRARYYVQDAEWRHWSEPSRLFGPDARHVRECVAPLFDTADVVIAGPTSAITRDVTLVPLPGHTPGHVGVLIQSRGERAIVIGDASHYLAQIEEPGWSPVWDHDRRAAAATRAALFDALEADGSLAMAGHWPHPGAGRLIRVAGRRVFAAS